MSPNIDPVMKACLANAGRLLESAKAVRSIPDCNNVAFNLAVLALEEIGKSILLFQEALEFKPSPSEEEDKRSPIDWIDDHERKLFWAIWFGDNPLDWRAFPEYLSTAKLLHSQRLRVLYFDPQKPEAQAEISEEYLSSTIALIETRLQMEMSKKYQELGQQDRDDIQWFFIASEHPDLKPLIFSKASLENQIELNSGPEWLKWVRKTVEESQRSAYEIAQRELERKQPEHGDLDIDKWKMRIKLKSWSHSVRQSQLVKWNESIDKIKLQKGSEHNDLTVDFIVPKSITLDNLWNAGMQNNVFFVSCLNIASLGFFWWYLPVFTSRFHDSITDLENNTQVVIDRVPELKVVWPRQALKDDVLQQNLPVIFGFVARAREDHVAIYHKYFGSLALMAKNDMFFQFEHNLVHDFIECLEMAMKGYGDWDGDASTFDRVIKELVPNKEGADEFSAMVIDLRRIAGDVKQRTLKEPVTLEHAIRAKLAFDSYIHVKARAHFADEIAKGNTRPQLAED